jgi:hypothetical protein
MDTPLHALAVPDADPSTLKRPEAAAREIADAIAVSLRAGAGSTSAKASVDKSAGQVEAAGVTP